MAKKIGVVVRDIQINVYDSQNKPPVNGPLYNSVLRRDVLISALQPPT